MNDAEELEWWRCVFSTRFRQRNLPKPGDALYGKRLILVEDTPYGEKTYDRGRD